MTQPTDHPQNLSLTKPIASAAAHPSLAEPVTSDVASSPPSTRPDPISARSKARTIVISALARVRELSKLHPGIRYQMNGYDLWRYARDPNFRIDLITPSMADSIVEELNEIEAKVVAILNSIKKSDPATLSPILSEDE